MSINGRHALNLLIFFICFSADLVSKYCAHAYLQPEERNLFIPGLINLTLVSNTGCAFSIGKGHNLITLIVVIIVYLFLATLYVRRYFLSHKQTSMLEQLGMSIVLGAALGNLLERLCCGRVTDFFEFSFINFPIFNSADVLIDIGIGLILISAYQLNRTSSQHKNNQ